MTCIDRPNVCCFKLSGARREKCRLRFYWNAREWPNMKQDQWKGHWQWRILSQQLALLMEYTQTCNESYGLIFIGNYCPRVFSILFLSIYCNIWIEVLLDTRGHYQRDLLGNHRTTFNIINNSKHELCNLKCFSTLISAINLLILNGHCQRFVRQADGGSWTLTNTKASANTARG